MSDNALPGFYMSNKNDVKEVQINYILQSKIVLTQYDFFYQKDLLLEIFSKRKDFGHMICKTKTNISVVKKQ